MRKLEAYLDLVVGMLGRATGQVVALLMTIIAIPLLSPSQFGVFAIASAFVVIVRTLLYSATFQYVIQTDRLDLYSTECLCVSAAIGALASGVPILVLLLADPFSEPEVLTFFLLLAPSNIISVFTAWQEAHILRGGRLKSYYTVTALTEIMSALVAIPLLFAGYGLYALAVQIYLRAIFLSIGYAFLGRPVLSTRLSVTRTGEVARWALPQYGSMATGLVSAHGADFIIGAILSPAATGVYRAASRITSAVGDICGQPVRIIALSLFSRRSSQGLDSGDALLNILGLCVLLPGSILLGLAVVSGDALPLLVDDEWQGLASIAAILCVGRFFAVIGGVSTPLLVAYKRQKDLLPTQIASGSILIIGLILVAPYGIVPAAIMTSVSLTVGGLAYVTLAARVARVTTAVSLRILMPTLICALASNMAAFLVLGALVDRVGTIVAVSASIAAAVLTFVGLAIIFRRTITEIVTGINQVEANSSFEQSVV